MLWKCSLVLYPGDKFLCSAGMSMLISTNSKISAVITQSSTHSVSYAFCTSTLSSCYRPYTQSLFPVYKNCTLSHSNNTQKTLWYWDGFESSSAGRPPPCTRSVCRNSWPTLLSAHTPVLWPGGLPCRSWCFFYLIPALTDVWSRFGGTFYWWVVG